MFAYTDSETQYQTECVDNSYLLQLLFVKKIIVPITNIFLTLGPFQ